MTELSISPHPLPAAAAPPIIERCDLELLIAGYRELLPIGPAVEPALAAALRDVLAHHGNLIRAQLAYAILAAAAPRSDLAVRVATALEYFHTASLVFDDLPAMDDAALRRGRPCPHRVWGDGIAILAALALVNRAYQLMWSAIAALPPGRREQAAALVGSCLGVDGILGGQARDLRFAAGARSEREALAVAEGKTVSLIRLTLVLPAILTGASRASRDRWSALARWWGLSYQILDDFRDELAVTEATGKSGHRDRALGRPNLPRLAGSRPALHDLTRHLASARSTLEGLPPTEAPAAVLRRVQAFLEGEASQVRSALDASIGR